jgi:hypothetical protein
MCIVLVNQAPKTKRFFEMYGFTNFSSYQKKADDEFVTGMNKINDQCCGFGSWIRCFFDFWTRDGKKLLVTNLSLAFFSHLMNLMSAGNSMSNCSISTTNL